MGHRRVFEQFQPAAISWLRAPTQLTVSLFSAHVVEADAAEIDRHFVFDGPHHDLEDAAQVLPLADRARDASQQRETLQLFAATCVSACMRSVTSR
jgi:hypothetical protein